MSILITGGAGFIGSHLTEHFTASGTNVVVLDNLFSGSWANIVHPQLVTLVEDDVADAALVMQLVANATLVFHLAAIASVPVCTAEPALATRTNVVGTQTVFDAVAAAQKASGRIIPVVYASSAAVYGDNPNIPLHESEPPAPINLYGEHKLENERIAARAFAEQNVCSVGLRFFNVYGPRQDPSSPYSGVISKFVDRARADQPLTIFGDGEQTRDFVYVGDVVRALVASATHANGAKVFNVGTGTGTSLRSLANLIGSIVGAADRALDLQPARVGDIRHSLANPTALMAAHHTSHWTLLRDGLTKMLRPNA